jgi:hypothetical protein
MTGRVPMDLRDKRIVYVDASVSTADSFAVVRRLRGKTDVSVLSDEAAFWRLLDGTDPDEGQSA